MSKDLAVRPPRVNEPSWRGFYEDAIYFVAGIYAAEQVRTRQRWAADRGSTLTAQQIAEVFAAAAQEMTEKIQRTSGTNQSASPGERRAQEGTPGTCVGHLGPPSNTGDLHPRGPTCSLWRPAEPTPPEQEKKR